MIESNEPNIKIFGIPESEHEHFIDHFQQYRARKADEDAASLHFARLDPEQANQIKEIDLAANEFFISKMLRLGIPLDELSPLSPTNYTHRSKRIPGDVGGSFDPTTSIIEIHNRGRFMDFFDSLQGIPHEKSHASVKEELRFYLTDKIEDSRLVQTRGAGIIGNHERLAAGIEEGLVIFDQVEFFQTVIKDRFPAEYAKRLNWTQDYLIKRRLSKLDPNIWGEISPDLVTPFIIANGPKIFGKAILPTPLVSTTGCLKEFLFIRKLCELLGRDELEKDESETGTNDAIQTGRDILDRDRYLRTNEAHRKIVKVLGGEKAKALFKFGAYDPNIDQAMALLVS